MITKITQNFVPLSSPLSQLQALEPAQKNRGTLSCPFKPNKRVSEEIKLPLNLPPHLTVLSLQSPPHSTKAFHSSLKLASNFCISLESHVWEKIFQILLETK